MSGFTLIYVFLQKYLVPFLFTIGLFYFVYGIIEYFIIGAGGDEDRAEHGRVLFLKSIAWFVLSILVFAAISLLGWLGALAVTVGSQNNSDADGGFNYNQREDILEVPDVPTR